MRRLLLAALFLFTSATQLVAQAAPELTIVPDEQIAKKIERREANTAKMQAKNVTLEMKNVPLTEFARQLSQQTEIPISIDRNSLRDCGMTVNAQVSVQVESVSPITAIQTIQADYPLTWKHDEEGITITTSDDRNSELQTEVYSLQDFAKEDPNSVQRFADLITENLSDMSWEEMGGRGVLRIYEDSLVVNQADEVHQEIAFFLSTVRKVKGFTNDHYLVQSLPVTPYTARKDDIRRHLETVELAIEFKKAPLGEALKELSTSGQISFQIDERSFRDNNRSIDMPVSIAEGQRTLRKTLDAFADSNDLQWNYLCGDQDILITTPDSNCHWEEVQLYPVRDLLWHGLFLESAEERQALEKMTRWQGSPWKDASYLQPLQTPGVSQLPDYRGLDEIIRSTIRPDSWESLGGAGYIQAVESIDCLLIRQMPEVHAEIAELLHQLRQQQSSESAQQLAERIQQGDAKLVVARYPVQWNARNVLLREEEQREIIQLIVSSIDGSVWQVPDTSIQFVQNELVIRQRRGVQREVLENMIELKLIDPTPPSPATSKGNLMTKWKSMKSTFQSDEAEVDPPVVERP